MKLLLSTALCFFIYMGYTQTFTGNVYLYDQAQVNAFIANNPGLTTIDGDISFRPNGGNISDLSGFSTLHTITGSLEFLNCPQLSSLNGFQNLTSLGWLYIQLMPNLADISQLSGLTQVSGLAIRDCNALTSLTGLQNITNITSVSGLWLSNNNILSDISALQNVIVSTNLQVVQNPVLTSFNFNNVTSLNYLYIGFNDNLVSFNLPALTSVDDLDFWSNTTIQAISGFSNLEDVISLSIIGNNQLTSVTPLENLNKDVIDRVEINSNSSLNTCACLGICQSLLELETWEASIYNNATGCNSRDEILDNCISDVAFPISETTTQDQCQLLVNTPISGLDWINIYDVDQNIICSINPNGSNMGYTSFSLFLSSTDRTDGNGQYYMNRDFTITPTTQPHSQVILRLYYTAAEYQDIINNDPNINTYADINMTKVSGPCNGSVNGNGVFLSQVDSGPYGNNGDIYIDFYVPSFSSFFASGSNLVLPVEWASPLKIEKLTNNNNKLVWSVSNQINNDRFEIMHSKNGFNFIQIGSIAGEKNSSSILQYSFEHHNVPKGVNYYKIRQVDYDGSISYSDLAKIMNGNNDEFNFYPNPVESQLSIYSPYPTEISIYDLSGKLMCSNNINQGQSHIDVSSYNPGIYLIKDKSSGKVQKLLIH